jgi:hypothetical protein
MPPSSDKSSSVVLKGRVLRSARDCTGMRMQTTRAPAHRSRIGRAPPLARTEGPCPCIRTHTDAAPPQAPSHVPPCMCLAALSSHGDSQPAARCNLKRRRCDAQAIRCAHVPAKTAWTASVAEHAALPSAHVSTAQPLEAALDSATASAPKGTQSLHWSWSKSRRGL